MVTKEGGARTAVTKKMLRFEQRLDNAKRNVDGRKPFSLIEKEERDARAARRAIAKSAGVDEAFIPPQ